MAGSVGEWQQVRRKKGARRSRGPDRHGRSEADDTVDVDSLRDRVTAAMTELRCEDFCQVWAELLAGCLAEDSERVHPPQDRAMPTPELDCVCYGLGSFSSCVASRFQLALLLLLLDKLQIPPWRCCVFDPVFSPAEGAVLQGLGLTVLTENEALYNNLLWRNWSTETLPHLSILGNSFRGIQERMLDRVLRRDYSYIAAAVGACEETVLSPPSTRFLDVFNDTALLRFPPTHLATLPPHIWANPPEPKYQHCEDLEIIQVESGGDTGVKRMG
ncbi:SRR1-like protein isoform X2 [Amia ocellicauda]|uniref:SRR1-like protein isoform X2 n=1 Tax=Amia ocellicauda TaxID=2972642 RepID=UPI003464394E